VDIGRVYKSTAGNRTGGGAVRWELKHLTAPRSVAWGMSDATKVVIGTVGVAGLLGVVIVLTMAF
jgi:hypothetical protein